MGLTPWKLLEYFSVDELKLVLSQINEPQTGNRDTLVERVIIEWPQHNKQWYHLLGYLDTPTLRMICNDFDLDKTGARDLLARKIKKELDKNAPPKPKSKEKEAITEQRVGGSKPEDFLHRNKKSIEKGTILAGISIFIAIFGLDFVNDLIFPPEPEINVTDLNAKDGIIEGTNPIYSYEPRTLIPNGTKNEVFYLTVSNTGDGHAKNFWIKIDSIPDGPWFDFHTSEVIHSGIPKSCQQKSLLCTIELVTKESGSIDLQYAVSFDHKLFQEIVNDTPKLLFQYGYDDGEEKEIEIFLKMG